MISEMVSPKTSQHLLLLRREDGCSAGRLVGAHAVCLYLPAGSDSTREQGGISAWQLKKCFLKIQKFACLEELLEAFKASSKEFGSYFLHFGLQRSEFDLMPAICFHFS